MALQGSLRDFSSSEILQLLGMQTKTGGLVLERGNERVTVFVVDGRIVSTRLPGMHPGDPLLAFLLGIHRLSDEQHRGIVTIQRESGRDLEDILVNGRYLDADELCGYLERQIVDDLARIVNWEHGTYRFETELQWRETPRVRLSMESVLIEAARRQDEQKRFGDRFSDPAALLSVRDLPDPDEPLAEEERDLFGIIDGRHTLAEVVAEAPLTEWETYEALDRMIQMEWIVFSGRREPDPDEAREAKPALAEAPRSAPLVRHSFARELALVAIVAVAAVGLRFAGDALRARTTIRTDDVFVTAQIRDVRYALEMHRRERGGYPSRLEDLAADRWIRPAQLRIPGHRIYYHLSGSNQEYELKLEPVAH
jgi:hypothetical protein